MRVRLSFNAVLGKWKGRPQRVAKKVHNKRLEHAQGKNKQGIEQRSSMGGKKKGKKKNWSQEVGIIRKRGGQMTELTTIT